MSAYFARVFRLTWGTRAISDLERPAASIDRISFTVSRGTVISSILPGRARQSNRPGKPYGGGCAPGPRGAALLLKLLNFSYSRCSFASDHSDHFLVNINTTSRAAPSPPRGAFTLVPGIMDMGVAKSADGAQAPVDSTFDEINRMFSKLGFIDYNSRLAQGPFNSPNLICLSHASRRRGGAFSRESIPVLLVRIPTCPYACCSAAFETSKPFDVRN